jgi:nucleoside phosphorylase
LKENQKKILKQFSPEIQAHIIQFCKELSAVKCDVFILFARKAACFITVLEDIGLLKLHGKVVTERVLDYDSTWLRDKSVVLVDDTIISGTAAYKAINNLKNIGVKSIDVRVFCINEFWFVKELFELPGGGSYLNKPFLKLDHTTSLKFCKDIVRAFSVYPRPYSIDFPIFEGIRLNINNFDSIQTLEHFNIVDTTSNLQLEQEIRCFSMNPRKAIYAGFFESLGIDLKEFSYLKLRVYSQKVILKEKQIFYYCRVLPLFIFDPIADSYLDSLVDAICQAEGQSSTSVTGKLTTSIAKLRFVQFYFAQRFFLYAIEIFEKKLGKILRYKANIREQELIFPPELVDMINNFQFTGKLFLQKDANAQAFLQPQLEKNRTVERINPLAIKDQLLFKFLDIYHTKELSARRKVKQFKKEAFNMPEFKEDLGRLEKGFTFGQLKESISNKVTLAADQNLILSNFLDNAIDSGIIVPVTLHENGFTSRGYRHGEEIIWGENNDKLMAVFYEKFLSKTEADDLSKFWFEKLLVLFLKMGLKGGALEEYNYLTPPPQATSLMGVRSYLYGQITVNYELKPAHETKFNPILDYETKGHWASQRLVDLNVLSVNKADRYELDFKHLYNLHSGSDIDSGEPSDLDDDLTGIVEEIAELLAIVRNYKILDAKGLVLLTSCISIHDCLPSIAAEIYIFHQQIEQIINSTKSSVVKPTLCTVDFLKNLRSSSKNYSWTAINSGTDKYLDYMNGEGEILIKKASAFFGNVDSFKKRSWDKYWKKEIERDFNDAPDLHALNNDIGTTLIEINVCMLTIQSLVYRKLELNSLMPLYLNQRKDELKLFSDEADVYTAEIKELSDRTIVGNQAAMDFNNAERLRELENKLKRAKQAFRDAKLDIDYWESYISDNLARTDHYFQAYVKIKPVPIFLSDAAREINLVQSLFNIEDVNKQIGNQLEVLNSFKDKSDFLLGNFSSLVPQWGKINPIIKYDGIIHVNTRSKEKSNRDKLGLLVKKELTAFELREFSSDTELAKSFVLLRPSRQMEYSGYYIGLRGFTKIDRFTKLAATLLAECEKLNMDYNVYYFPQLDEPYVLKAYYNKQTKFYDEIHEEFRPYFSAFEKPTEHMGRSLIIFPPRDITTPEKFKRTVEDSSGQFILVNSIKGKFLNGKNSLAFHIEIDKHPTSATSKDGIAKEKCIGIVTALPKEFAAVKVVFGDAVPNFKGPTNDPNDYAKCVVTSRAGEKINVIVALAKEMGNNAAANATTNMLRSFPEIDDVVICGIAGGIPHPTDPGEHVRLGDIVVSYKNGVLQYDNIKETSDEITIRSSPSRPSAKLSGYCNILESERILRQTPWNDYIKKHEKALLNSMRPAASKDILRINGQEIVHPHDPERMPDYPKIHFGPIGSANTLLKNEKKRDNLRDNYKVKAIEMEGSGIADGTWTLAKGYLIVRGICDYCNDDKNNDWQDYSAIIAASYAKCIVELL